MMEPILHELKEKVGTKASIIKIDVDKNQDLAAKLGVRGVPTLLVYKEGQLKWRESGVRQVAELEQILAQNS